MNEAMSLLVLSAFDIIAVVFGIYMLNAAFKMRDSKKMGTFLLTEEELKRCNHKEELADYFWSREAVMGVLFALFGFIRLVDKFILKIGGMLDVVLVVILLIAVLWFFKCLQNARTQFL